MAVVIPPGAWPSDPVREAGEWQHLKEIFRAARRQPAKSYARIQFQRLAGGSALLMWDDNGVRMVVADRDLPASRQRAALKAVRRARPALAALPVGLLLIDWLRRALGGHQLVTVGGAGLVAATTIYASTLAVTEIPLTGPPDSATVMMPTPVSPVPSPPVRGRTGKPAPQATPSVSNRSLLPPVPDLSPAPPRTPELVAESLTTSPLPSPPVASVTGFRDALA